MGNVFPALPGVEDVFVVAQCEPGHSLVLSCRLPDGQYQTTWAFVLDQSQSGQTRLIVRGRVAPGYRPNGLPQWLAVPLPAWRISSCSASSSWALPVAPKRRIVVETVPREGTWKTD